MCLEQLLDFFFASSNKELFYLQRTEMFDSHIIIYLIFQRGASTKKNDEGRGEGGGGEKSGFLKVLH